MGIALPLEKMSRKEKIQAMESLWDDLCRHAEKLQSPEWHGAVLEQREANLRVGEAEFSDWDATKKRIRKECE
jgi:putative addiction module component (TIGR02574 family)